MGQQFHALLLYLCYHYTYYGDILCAHFLDMCAKTQ